MNEVHRYMIRISSIYETAWILGCHISQVDIFNWGRRLTFPKPSLIWLAFSNVATDLNIRSFGRVERREQLGEVISFTAMRRYCLNVHMHLLDGSWDTMTNSGVLDNDLIDTRFKTQNVISFEPYYK